MSAAYYAAVIAANTAANKVDAVSIGKSPSVLSELLLVLRVTPRI